MQYQYNPGMTEQPARRTPSLRQSNVAWAIVGVTLIILWMMVMSSMGNTGPAPTRAAPAIGSVLVAPTMTKLWVDQGGLFAWDRAYANRDDRGMDAALTLYESFWLDPQTSVRITARVGEYTQLEPLDGPSAGRRGWTHAYWTRPS